MFISYTYIAPYTFDIIDSSFGGERSQIFPPPSLLEFATSLQDIAVDISTLLVYKRRNLPITRNMALMYKFIIARHGTSQIKKLPEYRDKIDKFYPELEFGNRYYDCVIRQLQQLSFRDAHDYSNL